MTARVRSAKTPPMPVVLNAVDAIADVWASIDGNLTEFRRGRTAKHIWAFGGHYAGYQAEAEEMIRRLKERGYGLRRLPRRPPDGDGP